MAMLHNDGVILYPAIDLRGGKCVRLTLGDFDRETVYGDDPVAVAEQFVSEGAEWIHVVDLDGARAGHPIQLEVVQRIVSLAVPVQMGGGVRNREALNRVLDAGVSRVVIGSALVKDESFSSWALEHHGAQIAAGIDAKDGMVAISGWEEGSDVTATELAQRLSEQGCQRIVFTDISRDGTLQGPNMAALEEMIAVSGAQIIASGGVASLADLVTLAKLQIEGVIVGKAIYEGRVSVAEGIRVLGQA